MSYSKEDLSRMENLLGANTDSHIEITKDEIILFGVKVWGPGSSIVEEYKHLAIPKKYPLDKRTKEKYFGRLEEHIYEYGEEGYFVPSFGLNCVIMAHLRDKVAEFNTVSGNFDIKDKELAEIYLDEDFPFHPERTHLSNTFVSPEKNSIISYPEYNDFPTYCKRLNGQKSFSEKNPNEGIDRVILEEEFEIFDTPIDMTDERCVKSGYYLSLLSGIPNLAVLYNLASFSGKEMVHRWIHPSEEVCLNGGQLIPFLYESGSKIIMSYARYDDPSSVPAVREV